MSIKKILTVAMLFTLVGCASNDVKDPIETIKPQPVKVVYFNPDGNVNLEVTYEYKDGNAVLIKENDLVSNLEYENNLLVKSTNEKRIIEYEYDSKGNEIKSTTNNGEMITIELNAYDSKNNLISKDTTINGENVMHIDYKYEKNQLIEMASDTLVVKYEYENNQCVKEKQYNSNKLVNEIQYVYDKNQLIETRYISENVITSILYHTYDSQGRIVKVETSLDQGNSRYISTQYEY